MWSDDIIEEEVVLVKRATIANTRPMALSHSWSENHIRSLNTSLELVNKLNIYINSMFWVRVKRLNNRI